MNSIGGRQNLVVDQIDVPAPGEGEVLIRVEAAGINFIDVYQREGLYPKQTPFTLGMEGAGTVVEVGPGGDMPEIGSRVAWAMENGAAAELAVVGAAQVVPVPEGVSSIQAAGAMLQGMTAHFLTNSTYAVQPGDAVLVHAAAGGVGQWLVQMCAAKRAIVVATAGTEAKLDKARSLGATHTINYSGLGSDELAAAVREAAGGGVPVAYDGVGRATFDASLASLRPRGLAVLFGAASGPVPPLELQRLNSGGSLFVTRPSLTHHLATREDLLWRAGEVFAALASGEVAMEIGGTFGLDQAAAAYETLEGRASTGKLIFEI